MLVAQSLRLHLRSVDPGALLDGVLMDFERGDPGAGIARLAVGLQKIRRSHSAEAYATFVATCKEHPLSRRLLADPYTRRARVRPRGYAGDAVMLDYVYAGLSREEAVSLEGLRVFHYTAGRAAPARSVRARKQLLAREIDRVASARPAARILSVACGHLREALTTEALHQSALGEFVALDQDEESLREVRRTLPASQVRTVHASIGGILRGELDLGQFDLIYAAGLYDYLAAPVATRLTAALFAALRPAGRLLIGNFASDFVGQAYMECFMDWSLVWRSARELTQVFGDVPRGALARLSTFRDAPGCVLYALAERAAQ